MELGVGVGGRPALCQRGGEGRGDRPRLGRQSCKGLCRRDAVWEGNSKPSTVLERLEPPPGKGRWHAYRKAGSSLREAHLGSAPAKPQVRL